MTRNLEVYAYQIIRQAAHQGAAEAATRFERARHMQLAGFCQRSARQIGAVA